MSTTIVIYQVVIAAIVIGGALLKGKVGLMWTAIGAVIWTLWHIVAPWLMLLQLFTIFVAYVIGAAIVREEQ